MGRVVAKLVPCDRLLPSSNRLGVNEGLGTAANWEVYQELLLSIKRDSEVLAVAPFFDKPLPSSSQNDRKCP